MSKAFVTGGGGFVASHLIKYLIDMDDEVVYSYRWNEDLSRTKSFQDKAKGVYMDLNDEISILRAITIHKPEHIYHLAAESYVPYSYEVPIQTIETNC